MVRYAVIELQNQNNAEDTVQEAFVIAQKNISKLMQSENPAAWLMNTLKYVILHEKRAWAKFARLCRAIEHAAPQRDHTGEVDVSEYVLVELLEQEEFKVLKLIYMDGHKMREAAGILDITYESCKKRVQTAKRKLSQRIN